MSDPGGGQVHARARIGDAPRWITATVLVGIFGTLGLCLVYFLVGVALAQTQVISEETLDASLWPLRVVVAVGSWAALGVMFRGYRRRRPLDEVDRYYYRLGLWLLTTLALGSRTPLALLPGAVLLFHTFVLDREVRQVEGVVPVTRRDREELTGEQSPRPRRRGFRRHRP